MNRDDYFFFLRMSRVDFSLIPNMPFMKYYGYFPTHPIIQAATILEQRLSLEYLTKRMFAIRIDSEWIFLQKGIPAPLVYLKLLCNHFSRRLSVELDCRAKEFSPHLALQSCHMKPIIQIVNFISFDFIGSFFYHLPTLF